MRLEVGMARRVGEHRLRDGVAEKAQPRAQLAGDARHRLEPVIAKVRSHARVGVRQPQRDVGAMARIQVGHAHTVALLGLAHRGDPVGQRSGRQVKGVAVVVGAGLDISEAQPANDARPVVWVGPAFGGKAVVDGQVDAR